MVATFNGWENMPEQERELPERWEEEEDSHCEGARRPKQSGRRHNGVLN